jgi:hypothetical protein
MVFLERSQGSHGRRAGSLLPSGTETISRILHPSLLLTTLRSLEHELITDIL